MSSPKKYLIYVLILNLIVPHIASAQNEDFVDNPAPQAPQKPPVPSQAQLLPPMKDPQAFNEYLLYDNPTLTQLSTVETTWMAQNKGERDEATMLRIEQQLSRQLQIELNSAVLPNAILTQAISFFRQVTCNKFSTVVNGEYKNRVTNTSRTSDGSVTQVIAGGSRPSEQRTSANELGQAILVQPRTHNFSSVQGETFQMAGRTVIDISEKSYRTDCIDKRYEFRGILNTERFIRFPAVEEEVKTILIRRGLLKLHQDFVYRAQNLMEALKLVTSSSYIGIGEVRRLGFESFDRAVSFMQMELTSLVSTYDFLRSAEDLFKTYNYIRLAKSIGGMANDARMKLDSLIATLEVFQAPHLQVILARDGREASNYIIFTERFLADTFLPVTKERGDARFQFKGESLDPSEKYRQGVALSDANSKRVAAETRAACLDNVKRLTKISHSGDRLSQFPKNELESIQQCTTMVTQWMPSTEALNYVRSKDCVFHSFLDENHGYEPAPTLFAVFFGMKGTHWYRYQVAILCPN